MIYIFKLIALSLALTACSMWVDDQLSFEWEEQQGGMGERDQGALGDGSLDFAPPVDGEALGGTPAGGASIGGASTGGTPVGGTPLGGTPVGGSPVGGSPVGGSPVGGSPVGGSPVGGSLVGGSPVGGGPVSGMNTGGEPVGGAPVFNELEELLPMGDCVVLDQDGGCLLTLQGTRDQRCIDHLLAVEAPDSTEALNPNLCTPSSPPLEDRDRANQLINVLRRLMGGPQVEFVTNRVHGECAIITDGEVTSGEWDASQVCFDEISENSLQPSSNFERIAGYWSTYDLAFGLLSATRGYRLLTRHWLLDPRGRKLRFGMNRGSSCLSPELRNELGSIPLSFYPGAGHVPLELIHPGNHKGEAPMWSVAITDRLSVNPTVEMITLTGPNDQGTPRAITTARPDPDHPELIGWTLDEPAREGETFLLKVSWQDSAMASRSVKLYSHLISCGQLMPVRCDPARVDECVVPGHSCVYYNYEPEDAPGWYCQRTGPLALGEPCSGYSGSCAGETLCFALTPNEPSRCVQRCVLGDDQSPNSCALRCANFAEVGEVAGSSIGVCVDP